jgi:hypothetical protein
VNESRRDLAAAKSCYERLTKGAEFAGTPFPVLAESRLASMQGLDAAFAFEPGLPPPPPADLGPPLVESQPAAATPAPAIEPTPPGPPPQPEAEPEAAPPPEPEPSPTP